MAKKGTIVRGADGKLYLLSQTGLEKLPDDQAKKVDDALPQLKQKLQDIVNQDMSQVAAGCNQTVHIEIPDVSIG
jgi:hypothetical protein